MLITRVELENIKCYQSAEFEFGAGVTAVCGPNGSGKTTILEAISWVLFDHIPYKKEDFLRRGEKRGWVRVSFTSSLDGREYTVYRDTGGGYYIYDPLTKIRLVEQKSQVAAWIRQHIGVEPTADLRALFTSAVGVPQGTFMSDFADQPYKRKLEFDRVLRVDEYQRSSDELLSLVRHIEKRVADAREEIARTEGAIANLDALKSELRANEGELVRVHRAIPVAERERDERRKELDALDRLGLELQRRSAEAELLRSKVSEGEVRLAALAEEVNRSELAESSLKSAEKGHATYLRSLQELKELDIAAAERDSIRSQLHSLERELAVGRTETGHLRETISGIEQDKKRLGNLRPMIERQERLERRRAEIQRVIGELGELMDRRKTAEREVKALRQEYKKITTAVNEFDSLMKTAERVPSLRKECKEVEAEVRAAQLARSQIEERRMEWGRVAHDIESLAPELARLNEEINRVHQLEPVALSVAALESRESETLDQIARIQARLESDRTTLTQIKEGLCPLLSQRCLNMKPGETLDQYFKLQVESEALRLNELMEQRNTLQSSLAEARSAQSICSTAESLKHQQERLAGEISALEARRDGLEAEVSRRAEVQQAFDTACRKLSAAEEALKLAQEAKVKYEIVLNQKERLEQVKQEGIEKRKLVEELNKRISESSGAADELALVEKEIANLGDPRGSARILEENAAKEPGFRKVLEQRQAEQKDREEKAAAIQLALNVFAELDATISTRRAILSQSEDDYHSFNQNKAAAEILGSRRNEHESVRTSLEADKAALSKLTSDTEQRLRDYDAERHRQVRTLAEDSTNQLVRLSFELTQLEERRTQLERRVEDLEDLASKNAEVAEKKRRWEDMLSTSELIRDLLRKAGPFITEAHLSSISIDANQLYRDITGNQMVTLRWDSGYEIVLEEDGYERAFASLSGGEQMVAALAVRLALLRELSEVRIAFFDEPTSSVDEQRRRNLAEQIGRIKDFDQLFVITHDDAFEGFTDHVISLGQGR